MSGSSSTLVLNCGSSSLKYLLLDGAGRDVAGGLVERLGTPAARHRHWALPEALAAEASRACPAPTAASPATAGGDGALSGSDAAAASGHGVGARHARDECRIEHTADCPGTGLVGGLARVAHALSACARPAVVAHRVVHGGTVFREATVIDADTLPALRALVPLAPLHMPGAIASIEEAVRAWPEALQLAVFDTAFHAGIPTEAAAYALPAVWRDGLGLRRYGFHGSAHASALQAAAGHLGREPGSLDLITLHLGNGASASAIRQGLCVETSMGFTPLEGLVMGTRSGDIDPALPLWLVTHAGLPPREVERMLLEESGLRGLCGEADMQRVCERARAGDGPAELALAVYCHRIRKYLGAYAAVLGHLDAITFSGGVGENAGEVRERVCAGLGILGIAIDPLRNREGTALPRAIHADDSQVAVLVVKADEEREIARAAAALLARSRGLS